MKISKGLRVTWRGYEKQGPYRSRKDRRKKKENENGEVFRVLPSGVTCNILKFP